MIRYKVIASGTDDKKLREFYERVNTVVIDICERESAPGSLQKWGDFNLTFTTFIDESLRAVLHKAAPFVEMAFEVRRGDDGGRGGANAGSTERVPLPSFLHYSFLSIKQMNDATGPDLESLKTFQKTAIRAVQDLCGDQGDGNKSWADFKKALKKFLGFSLNAVLDGCGSGSPDVNLKQWKPFKDKLKPFVAVSLTNVLDGLATAPDASRAFKAAFDGVEVRRVGRGWSSSIGSAHTYVSLLT